MCAGGKCRSDGKCMIFTLAHKSCVGQAVSLLLGNFKGFFDSIR